MGKADKAKLGENLEKCLENLGRMDGKLDNIRWMLDNSLSRMQDVLTNANNGIQQIQEQLQEKHLQLSRNMEELQAQQQQLLQLHDQQGQQGQKKDEDLQNMVVLLQEQQEKQIELLQKQQQMVLLREQEELQKKQQLVQRLQQETQEQHNKTDTSRQEHHQQSGLAHSLRRQHRDRESMDETWGYQKFSDHLQRQSQLRNVMGDQQHRTANSFQQQIRDQEKTEDLLDDQHLLSDSLSQQTQDNESKEEHILEQQKQLVERLQRQTHEQQNMEEQLAMELQQLMQDRQEQVHDHMQLQQLMQERQEQVQDQIQMQKELEQRLEQVSNERRRTEKVLQDKKQVVEKLQQQIQERQKEQEIRRQKTVMSVTNGPTRRLRGKGTDLRKGQLGRGEKDVSKDAHKGVYHPNPNWLFLSMIDEYRNNGVFHPLRESDPVVEKRIVVCVRKRPFNKPEIARNEVDVISMPRKNEVVVHDKKTTWDGVVSLVNKSFKCDYAFDETCDNNMVYKYTTQPLLQRVFDGATAACFAFGDTGSGITHTMCGGNTNTHEKGIFILAAEDAFQVLQSPKYNGMVISASLFEIYCGDVFDLLANKTKLDIFEDKNKQVLIEGLTEQVVDSLDDLLKLIKRGNAARTVGKISAKVLPRSDVVLQIVVWKRGVESIQGTLSLVDLASTDPALATSPSKKLRNEASEHNRELLTLRECIWAMNMNNGHIPFRESKLTHVLRDAFTKPTSRVCIIAMLSPGMRSTASSVNTLRYVERVMDQKD
jgi:hypothetical protein